MPAPVFTTAQVRSIEQDALRLPQMSGTPTLMERAGLAAAEYARATMDDTARRVLVIAGPGNNGGDAFEVAAHLRRWFFHVTVVHAGGQPSSDTGAAIAKWKAAGGNIEASIPARGRWDFVVDGVFGIGLQRPLAGAYATLVENINALRLPVLSLDIPSGINADTGAVMGCAVRATRTISFIGMKPGLLTLDGPDYCGELRVDALGLDTEPLLQAQGHMTDANALAQVLARRPRNFHKGLAGTVAIVGGATGMVGAALLAGRAALKCGSGRVHLALLTEDPPRVDYRQPELMFRDGLYQSQEITVIAAGPGMGRGENARTALRQALASPAVLLLDADALNLVSESEQLAESVAERRAATLLTPHPAEAARLLGMSTRDVQNDRLAAAMAMAARYHAFAALKGNGTVIAAPDGRWWINSTGNPGMASAGMGDALTGIVAGLAAQCAAPLDALLAGVWLHGAAGDAVAQTHGGPLGVTASEVIDSARALLNRLVYRAAAS